VLLAKRTKPPFKWSFPGGSIEPGESAEQAAVREVREEVSLDIALIAQADEREVLLPGRRYLISVFAARLVAGEAQTGPEASEIGWFALEAISALDATDGLLESARAAERVFLAARV
jgi:ADP-ribose pyrophosphatase YjhB (NUDIX family)